MGTSKSKLLTLNNDIKAIKSQLEDLKTIDKNNDGVITKNELNDWKLEQKKTMIDLESKIESQVNNKYNKLLANKNKEMTEAIKQIDELTKQINSLKIINTKLEQKLLTKQNKELPKDKIQELSKEKINEFVEKLLADENVNIAYLPDFVERQIYKNIFSLLIGLMDNVVNSTNIKLLGHNITLNIIPDNDKDTPTNGIDTFTDAEESYNE